MQVVTVSNGKKTVKMSKKEWQDVGRKAGWMKKEAEDKNPYQHITLTPEIMVSFSNSGQLAVTAKFKEGFSVNANAEDRFYKELITYLQQRDMLPKT